MPSETLFAAILIALALYGYFSIYRTFQVASAQGKCVLCLYLMVFGYSAGLATVLVTGAQPSDLMFWLYLHGLGLSCADIIVTMRAREAERLPTVVELGYHPQENALRLAFRRRRDEGEG